MATGSKCPICGAHGPNDMPPCGCDYRTVSSLHEEPQKDGFQHETPIRAFTTWTVDGHYALGKGFRPSLQHLVPYLNAMEGKEHWRLVQVLEAGTQTPSFLFRRERPPLYAVSLPAAEEISPEFKKRVDEYLAQAPHIDGQRIRVYPSLGDIDNRIADPVMPEVRTYLDQRDYGDENPEPPCSDIYKEMADAIMQPQPIGSARVIGKHPALGEPYVGKAHRPGCASLPRGEGECNCGGNPNYGRRADDPVNPKHYGGTACAEIGELLTANSYQVLKYNWRLGEKDDEKVELGKAIWYLEREMDLVPFVGHVPRSLPEYPWFDERLRHATPHAQAVARILISWNRYGNAHSLKGLRKNLKRMLAELIAKSTLDMGRGLEP